MPFESVTKEWTKLTLSTLLQFLYVDLNWVSVCLGIEMKRLGQKVAYLPIKNRPYIKKKVWCATNNTPKIFNCVVGVELLSQCVEFY